MKMKEIAASKTAEQGPGSFQVEFLNQLSNVTAEDVEQYGNVEEVR